MKHYIVTGFYFFLGFLLTGCGVEIESDSELSSSLDQIRERAPADLSRRTRCELNSRPAKDIEGTFRSKSIRYANAEEISYDNPNWQNKGNPWISWEGLNASLLDYPGFPGGSRFFRVDHPVNLRIAVIDVRMIEGVPHYHYLTNETGGSPMEQWSTTKAISSLHAGLILRRKVGIGLRSKVFESRKKSQWLGEIFPGIGVTSQNPTSNWVKSIPGPAASDNFVSNWLNPASEFGGRYGPGFAQIGSEFRYGGDGETRSLRNPIPGNWNSSPGTNTLTPFDMAEFWKRVAVNTLDPKTWIKDENYSVRITSSRERQRLFFNSQRVFGINNEDLIVFLYGRVFSRDMGGYLAGGLKSSAFVAAFGGKASLDDLSEGRWRLFGKTGSGYSNERGREESAFSGYFCLPANSDRVYEPHGRLVAFAINAQTKERGNARRVRDRALHKMVEQVLPGLKGN